MQRLKRGDISFFKLSLINPKIFSKQAVSCCLNNIAGYLASIQGKFSSFPPAIGDFTDYNYPKKKNVEFNSAI